MKKTPKRTGCMVCYEEKFISPCGSQEGNCNVYVCRECKGEKEGDWDSNACYVCKKEEYKDGINFEIFLRVVMGSGYGDPVRQVLNTLKENLYNPPNMLNNIKK